MDLGIKDQVFLVTGASSGLGRAVTLRLVLEGARVIATARRKELLEKLSAESGGMIEPMPGDVLDEGFVEQLSRHAVDKKVNGVFVNAGGPPAKMIAETNPGDWDNAYRSLVRWKVALVLMLLPHFSKDRYGRILFSESSSILEPVENLVLSNSLRMAIAGFSKTICQEYTHKGINANVIAPGSHDTAAMDRLFLKKSQQEDISVEEARKKTIDKIPAGVMGSAEDFATLAVWLLSPMSKYVSGQVYSLDGGSVRSTL